MTVRVGIFVAVVGAFAVLGCPDGWEVLDGTCYHFSNDSQSYMNALAVCKLMGSQLVEIENNAENDFVTKHVAAYSRVFWIGLNDLEIEGNYIYTATKRVPEFTSWGEGNPENNDDSKNCVIINPIGHWNTIPCPATLAYVCEKEDISKEEMDPDTVG